MGGCRVSVTVLRQGEVPEVEVAQAGPAAAVVARIALG